MSHQLSTDLSVGDLAARAGVAVSTLHYYESEGLIESWRTPANHRRFDRSVLRRVAVIRAAQSLGVPLAEIREVLSTLPKGRKVTKEDWGRAAAHWADRLDDRIEALLRLRDTLDHCIGCGCLSLASCPLYNRGDHMAAGGSGPRRWKPGN